MRKMRCRSCLLSRQVTFPLEESIQKMLTERFGQKKAEALKKLYGAAES
jgi:hypothetical protein